MRYIPHLRKGGELYHYRTFGSRNGISTTPGYKAKGKKAVGVLTASGRYVYDNGYGTGSRNNSITLRRAMPNVRTTNSTLIRTSGRTGMSQVRTDLPRSSKSEIGKTDGQRKAIKRSAPTIPTKTGDAEATIGKVAYRKVGPVKVELSEFAQRVRDKNLAATEKKNAPSATNEIETNKKKGSSKSKSSGSSSRKSGKKSKGKTVDKSKKEPVAEKKQNNQIDRRTAINTAEDAIRNAETAIDREAAMRDLIAAYESGDLSSRDEGLNPDLIALINAVKSNYNAIGQIGASMQTLPINEQISRMQQQRKLRMRNDALIKRYYSSNK